MGKYFIRVKEKTPTRMWINNVTPSEARLAVEAGAVACTQNPSYPWKMLTHKTESAQAQELLAEIMREEPDDNIALTAFQRALVGRICNVFLPIYEASRGEIGYVSIQGDPFNERVESILGFARYNRQAAPNIICKIPATKDGLAAMDQLVRERVPVLATEVMSVDQAMDVNAVYEAALKETENPAPMFMAHIPGIFDEQLAASAEAAGAPLSPDCLHLAGVTVAKKIRRLFDIKRSKVQMVSGGARGLHHFTEMVGARSDVTINWTGTAEVLIASDPPVIDRFNAPTPLEVIDYLLENSPEFRKAYTPGALAQEEYEGFGPVVRFRTQFENAWSKSLKFIAERR